MPPPTRRTLTPREIEARRRNARRSTGPRTAEGKSRSSLNSFRRDLCPDLQEAVMKRLGENRADFLRLERDLIWLLAPVTDYERVLVARLADAWWGKLRLYGMWPRGLAAEFPPPATDQELDDLLLDWMRTLVHDTRKWHWLLERLLGGPARTAGEVRARIESRSRVLRERGDAPRWDVNRRPAHVRT